MRKKLISRTVTAVLILVAGSSHSFAKTNQELEARLKILEARFESLSEETTKFKPSKVSSVLNNAKVFGRLQVDGNWYNQDQAMDTKSDGIDIARARLGIRGEISKNLNYKFENDFAENASEIKDAFVAYTGFKNSTITFGQSKPTFSMEILESSNHMEFIERSLAEDSVLGRLVGVKADKRGEKWRIAAGIFGEAVGNEAREDDSKYSMTARATIAPINTKDQLLHLGLATSHTSRDRNIDATTDDTLDKEHLIGGELIARYNAFTLKGEYIMNAAEYDSNSGSGDTVDFTSYYVQASLFLTGEYRAYSKKAAKLGKINVKSAFDKGGIGAFELSARVSHLDKNDKSIIEGKSDNYSIGLNWYINNNVRVMLNYLESETDYANAKNSEGYDAVSLRTRIYF